MKDHAPEQPRSHLREQSCAETAELLSTAEGLARARHLQRGAFFGRTAGVARQAAGGKKPAVSAATSGASQPDLKAENGEPQPISIWQPENADGELIFVRPDPLPLGDHYSATTTLKAKKNSQTRRILLPPASLSLERVLLQARVFGNWKL